MNDNQKALFGNDFGLIYYPYDFSDAIANHCSYSYTEEQLNSLSEMGKYWKFIENHKSIWDKNFDSITIEQDKMDEKGTLTFVGLGVRSISVYTKNKTIEVELVKSIFKGIFVGNIPVDFDNPIKTLKFNFLYEMAEPYELEVNMVKYKEPEIDYQAIYISNMKVSFDLGQDLLNVYFQLADEKVDKTEIFLYKTFERNESRMIAKYEVEKELYYYAIKGLAYGTYEFQVVQYVKNKVLVENPKTKFTLAQPNYSGKPVISGR
jgi:hypothetical protein